MKIQLDSNAINSLFPDGTGARLELQQAVIQNFVKKVRFAQLEQEIADKLGIIDGVMRREIESQIKKEITERFGVDIESSSYFSLASDCSELKKFINITANKVINDKTDEIREKVRKEIERMINARIDCLDFTIREIVKARIRICLESEHTDVISEYVKQKIKELL